VLTESSKENLLEGMETISHELMLKELLRRCRSLFVEARHQRFLQRFSLSYLWGIRKKIAWLMFANAIVMNCLVIAYFALTTEHSSSSTATPHGFSLSSSSTSGVTHSTGALTMPSTANYIVVILNSVQVLLACVTIFIHMIGLNPVTYQLQRENGNNLVSSLIAAGSEPITLWYTVYLVVACIALKYDKLWLTCLLLDWVMLDSTTRDVLRAVQYPARQLMATLIIILICINIFAGILFTEYRMDIITFDVTTLWDCFKMCFSYGLRGEYGVSHEMSETLGLRMIFDMTFYIIVSIFVPFLFFLLLLPSLIFFC